MPTCSKNALVSGSPSSSSSSSAPHAHAHAHHSFLQTEEVEKPESQKLIEEAFYAKMSQFLETQSKTTDSGGDFEFKCDTSCQLVEQNSIPQSATTGTQATSPTTGSPTTGSTGSSNNGPHNFLETEAGLESEQKLEAQAQVQTTTTTTTTQSAQPVAQQQVKDCYRLCLNPSMNPGCDVASQAVSLLETGEMTEQELMRKNWSLGSGSGNCLNSCVHVCMAVHNSSGN